MALHFANDIIEENDTSKKLIFANEQNNNVINTEKDLFAITNEKVLKTTKNIIENVQLKARYNDFDDPTYDTNEVLTMIAKIVAGDFYLNDDDAEKIIDQLSK